MGSCGCKKKNCIKCSGSKSDAQTLADVVNKLNEIEAALEQVQSDTKFLQCGSPIMMLQRESDIACFDMETGLGSECWDGWVVCDGGTYQDSGGENFETPNMFNRFPVGAGDAYIVGATGGADSVTLIVSQIPAHAHTVTDPGHTHTVTDPGHNHGATSAPHTHTFTGTPHTHEMATAGTHAHNVQVGNQGTGLRGGGENNTATSGLSTFTTDGNGDHVHVISNGTAGGTVGDASAAITVSNAFTGITNVSDTTGITLVDTGGGESHENRPPYYAVLFVIKLS